MAQNTQNTFTKVDNGDGTYTITSYTYNDDGTCSVDTYTGSEDDATELIEFLEDSGYIDEDLTVIHIGKYTVPYVTAPSNGKLRFPVVDTVAPVMGLPPMSYGAPTTDTLSSLSSSIVSSVTSSLMSGTGISLGSFARGFITNTTYGYNSYQQALQSFPILNIEPLDIVYNSKKGEKGADGSITTNVLPVKYRFAVDPQNLTISYSHTNNFQESGIENNMKTFMQRSDVNEIRQFAATSSGMFGSGSAALTSVMTRFINGMTDKVTNFLNNLANSSINNSELSDGQKDFLKSLTGMGNSFLDTWVGGGRIDFPNIWTDSQTTNSQSFTIHLRTLSPNPNNKQYWREILLPLYCLMTLGLPPGGSTSTYFNPPYIKCSLDNGFYEVLLGGISSISWDFPANEFNFLKVPRHISVNLTITDMYNIMSQDTINPETKKVIENTNLNFTTKDMLIERFAKSTDDKKVYNSTLMSTEFDWSGIGSVLNTASGIANTVDSLLGTTLTDTVSNIYNSVTGTISSTIDKAVSSVTDVVKNTVSNVTSSITGSSKSGSTGSTGSTGSGSTGSTGSGSSSDDEFASLSSRTVKSTSVSANKTKFLDDEPEEEIKSLFSKVGIHFGGNDPTAGDLEFITSDGIVLCTFSNVKNVVPTSTDSSIAVKDLLSNRGIIYGSDGFDVNISICGETPEISPQFLTNISSKVRTKLRYLFGYTD